MAAGNHAAFHNSSGASRVMKQRLLNGGLGSDVFLASMNVTNDERAKTLACIVTDNLDRHPADIDDLVEIGLTQANQTKISFEINGSTIFGFAVGTEVTDRHFHLDMGIGVFAGT